MMETRSGTKYIGQLPEGGQWQLKPFNGVCICVDLTGTHPPMIADGDGLREIKPVEGEVYVEAQRLFSVERA